MSNLAQRSRLLTQYFLWCSSGWDTVALVPSIEVCLDLNLTTSGRYHAPLSVILVFFVLFFFSFSFLYPPSCINFCVHIYYLLGFWRRRALFKFRTYYCIYQDNASPQSNCVNSSLDRCHMVVKSIPAVTAESKTLTLLPQHSEPSCPKRNGAQEQIIEERQSWESDRCTQIKCLLKADSRPPRFLQTEK